MKEIIQKNIEDSKIQIKKELTKDLLIIFLTRIVEDIEKNVDNFKWRYLEIKQLLNPYSSIQKISFDDKFGMEISEQEKKYLQIFLESLNEDYQIKNANVVKGRLKKAIEKLCENYLPHSSQIVEPIILAKMLGAMAGIKNFSRKPASTIQLIGAEKALQRHIIMKKDSPKYGLLYKSKFLQSEKDKGKTARKLANKLAITIKQDYFQNFPDDETLTAMC